MILDVLGVLIAFTLVVLLLSIIVTSLVQITQATFKLRGRNLIVGIAALLRLATAPAGAGAVPGAGGSVGGDAAAGAADPRRPDDADRRDARAILNTLAAGNLRPARDPQSLLARFLGPTVSWIDRATFLEGANAVGRPVANANALTEQFKVIEAAMEKRFLFRMRIVAAFWALLVAFVFQVSTPEYLRDLWSKPEMRRQLEEAAAVVLTDATEAMRTFEGYGEASERALEKLAAMHPEARELIEEASGVGTTRPYIVDELNLAVESAPNRAQIVADYERLLDEERLAYADELAVTAGNAGITLAALRIEPWSGRWEFYRTAVGFHWRHFGGVLMTAMLLVLGAPFWFNVLKTLTNLRDAMKGRLQAVTPP